MKKLILTLLLPVIFPVCSLAGTEYLTTGENINIRVDSTIQADSLGQLANNDIVEVVNEKFGWYQIILPGKINCFLAKQFCEITEEGRVRVISPVLNIRSGASLKSHILGSVAQNSEFEMIAETPEWFKINAYPQARAWVHASFLEPVKTITEPAIEQEVEFPE